MIFCVWAEARGAGGEDWCRARAEGRWFDDWNGLVQGGPRHKHLPQQAPQGWRCHCVLKASSAGCGNSPACACACVAGQPTTPIAPDHTCYIVVYYRWQFCTEINTIPSTAAVCHKPPETRSVYDRSLLARQLPRHQSGPPSCGCKAGCLRACGGNAPVLEKLAVETLDVCILINSLWRETLAFLESAHRVDEKRWVRCPNKQQEPKHIYKPTTRTRTRRRTHRTADATDTEAGGPGRSSTPL